MAMETASILPESLFARRAQRLAERMYKDKEGSGAGKISDIGGVAAHIDRHLSGPKVSYNRKADARLLRPRCKTQSVPL